MSTKQMVSFLTVQENVWKHDEKITQPDTINHGHTNLVRFASCIDFKMLASVWGMPHSSFTLRLPTDRVYTYVGSYIPQGDNW